LTFPLNSSKLKPNKHLFSNPHQMKKLYTLLCALGLIGTAQAEIVYESFGENGWRIPLHSAATLDVDQDGSIDFVFNGVGEGTSIHAQFLVGCTGAEYTLNPATQTYDYLIKSYDDGDVIGNGDYFDEGRPLPIWDAGTGGVDAWADGNAHYAGFMLWNGHTYGWMKIGYDATNGDLIIYEWAWDNTGDPIEAGARGANSVAEYALAEVNTFPNPATDHVNLQFNQELAQVKLSVYDMGGRKVYAQVVRPNFGAIHRLNTSQWEQGQYLIRIEAPEGNLQRKVSVLR